MSKSNLNDTKKDKETLYMDVDEFFKNKKIDTTIYDNEDSTKKVGEQDVRKEEGKK